MRSFVTAAAVLVVAFAALALTGGTPASATSACSMYHVSMGQPYQGSVWNKQIGTAPTVDPNSSALVGLVQQALSTGGGNFDATNGPNPYIASGQDPLKKVTLAYNNVQLQQVWNQVPWPACAQPAQSTDAHMAIWQPETNCIWEFWKLAQQSDGSWGAQWGGRMCHVLSDPGVFRNVKDASGNVLEKYDWGTTATSFPLLAGAMMVDEIGTGTVDHAVSMAISNNLTCSSVFNKPAQRTDGSAAPNSNTDPSNCVPEGTRFFLPASYNLAQLANAPVIVRQLAQAAQTYGLIIDNSTRGLGVEVESGASISSAYQSLGGDPYTQSVAAYSDSPFFYNPANGQTLNAAEAVRLFPWSALQTQKLALTSVPDTTWYAEGDPPAPAWPSCTGC